METEVVHINKSDCSSLKESTLRRKEKLLSTRNMREQILNCVTDLSVSITQSWLHKPRGN